jgi:hypothetical protein
MIAPVVGHQSFAYHCAAKQSHLVSFGRSAGFGGGWLSL